jgi:hypothetical protein
MCWSKRNAIQVGFWPLVPGPPPSYEERRLLPEKSSRMDKDIRETEEILQAALDEARDPSWRTDHPDEYAAVVYLSHPESEESYRGSSSCRVCECHNGSRDFFRGPFVYPEGYLHYITEHGFRPPRMVIVAAMQEAGR